MKSWTSIVRSPVARTLFKAAIGLAVAASVVVALKGYRQALAGRTEHLSVTWLLVALALGPIYRVVNAYGWVLVLRSLGDPTPALPAVRLWLVSETLRWLPGSVWSFLSRVAQAKSAGVHAATASLSLPLELLLCIGAWSFTAAVGVGVSGTARAWLSWMPATSIAAVALGLMLSVAGAFALARWLPATSVAKKLRGLEEGLRRLRAARPRIGPLVAAFALFTALSFLSGGIFLAVLEATRASTPSLLAAIGINAAGWLVGFFAFFAPAGLAVREGAMAAMLAPLMPLDAAVVGVLLWRLIQILGELICLAACFLPSMASAARRLATRSPSAT